MTSQGVARCSIGDVLQPATGVNFLSESRGISVLDAYAPQSLSPKISGPDGAVQTTHVMARVSEKRVSLQMVGQVLEQARNSEICSRPQGWIWFLKVRPDDAAASGTGPDGREQKNTAVSTDS
jgi:hypothetical protein